MALPELQSQSISIHALREEGDHGLLDLRRVQIRFLSTPSARRATEAEGAAGCFMSEFLSTPSARRATSPSLAGAVMPCISIHALREEGDRKGLPRKKPVIRFLSTPSARRATAPRAPLNAFQNISIHALREEGDQRGGLDAAQKLLFLSTPSARRATTRLP